jgi:hypothetical protein
MDSKHTNKKSTAELYGHIIYIGRTAFIHFIRIYSEVISYFLAHKNAQAFSSRSIALQRKIFKKKKEKRVENFLSS